MRQGGMKPKSHTSGVYWVRAGSKSGGGGGKKEKTKHQVGIDIDGDGVADVFGEVVENSTAPQEKPQVSENVWAFIIAVIACVCITFAFGF